MRASSAKTLLCPARPSPALAFVSFRLVSPASLPELISYSAASIPNHATELSIAQTSNIRKIQSKSLDLTNNNKSPRSRCGISSPYTPHSPPSHPHLHHALALLLLAITTTTPRTCSTRTHISTSPPTTNPSPPSAPSK